MIASMTGFARASGPACPPAMGWTWEVRSVNGKGLDVRLRLPPGYEALDVACRELIAKTLTRGNVSASLTLHALESRGGESVMVNQALLGQLMDLARNLPAHIAPPTFDGLLTVRGVLVSGDEQGMDEAQTASHHQALIAGLQQALCDLSTARQQEGQRLEGVLHGHLATIRTLIDQAEQCAALRPEAIRARFHRQVAEILDCVRGEGVAIPEDRLIQELALLATRLDIREELDRLRSHLAQALDLLHASGACGRRLDFLCQEFNREANTLCSKSQDSDLTRLGLDLKAVIDQLREQVQNVE